MMKIYLNGKNSDKFALIDKESYDLISKYKWYLSTTGYATSTFHNKGKSRVHKDRNINLAMHRLIMGSPPESGLIVDHINRDRLDNRLSNLRWVTVHQNARNSNPACGYKGVKKAGRNWHAKIHVDRTHYHLGSYPTDREAAMAYDKAARHFFGEHAYLNIPDEVYDKKVRYVDYEPELKVRKSKYKGVSFFGHGGKRIRKWRAVYRRKNLGYYMTEYEAHLAYERAVNEDKKKN